MRSRLTRRDVGRFQVAVLKWRRVGEICAGPRDGGLFAGRAPQECVTRGAGAGGGLGRRVAVLRADDIGGVGLT